MLKRRFPPPWTVEDIGGSFVVKARKLLTRDAARRIAAGIAKLPGLVQWLSKGTH
jgi:hypothetical protein